MTSSHLNPCLPITMQLGQEDITAFSISALASYVLLPQLGVAFDMGECPLEAVPLDKVFLSHAHGDHARCLLRHESLRRLMGMEPAEYFIPDDTHQGFQALADAWRQLERVRPKNFNPPRFVPLKPGETRWLHRQLAVKTFAVDHSLPSLGYTLYDVRKKLKDEFAGRPGHELAQLRKEGTVFEEEIWLPRLTYIGDSTIDTLYRETHVGLSKVLFLEVTFLMDDERDTARARGHTHLLDLLEFLRERPGVLQNEHIVLKHFSMRYDRKFILRTLKSRLPPEFLERVTILL
ncbi:MAG: MBL fold metallo-hydrolase [Deltaproteobacteria bacterium]|nr:MBL fold metallo-hydrolase [Deltaproteobacteria bacterium]